MRAALAGILLVAVTGCGVLDYVPPGGDGGIECYVDTDCAPNGCCGEGTAAVPLDLAPDCSGVVCSGTCPEGQVNCGCGLPVCRQNQCTVAVSTDPQCP